MLDVKLPNPLNVEAEPSGVPARGWDEPNPGSWELPEVAEKDDENGSAWKQSENYTLKICFQGCHATRTWKFVSFHGHSSFMTCKLRKQLFLTPMQQTFSLQDCKVLNKPFTVFAAIFNQGKTSERRFKLYAKCCQIVFWSPCCSKLSGKYSVLYIILDLIYHRFYKNYLFSLWRCIKLQQIKSLHNSAQSHTFYIGIHCAGRSSSLRIWQN